MNPTSLNNPRIEKDFELLKTISETCIDVQPLIKKLSYLAALDQYGLALIDTDGTLTVQAHIIIETAVYKELTAYIGQLKQAALNVTKTTDEMFVVITNFNVYQEELDYEFNQLLAELKSHL